MTNSNSNSIGSYVPFFAPVDDNMPITDTAPDAAPAIPPHRGAQPMAPESAAPFSLHHRDVACGPDGSLGPSARLELRYLAMCTFNKVRSHFRGSDKSSNKVRMPYDESDRRAVLDVLRWLRADDALGQLREYGASLDERWAAKVGNCTEMARMAVVEARKMGLRADIWSFLQNGEPSAHAFALVELRRENLSSAYALGSERRTFDRGDDFWVVDPWAGICCPGSKYDPAFVAKMEKWAAQNKQIYHGGKWRPADDFNWLRATLGRPRGLLADCPFPYHPVWA
jgi:hypothetical protein